MPIIPINKIKEHPMNQKVFENIKDVDIEKWDAFVESIKERVLEPILITQDMVIVSGHQRYKACIESGIEEIDCIIKYYDNEDDVLYDLICSNKHRRGNLGKENPIIRSTRAAELERLCGIVQGRHASHTNNARMSTKKEIAEFMGTTEKGLEYDLNLQKAIPEIQEKVSEGKLSVSAVARSIAKLSHEEQRILVETTGLDVLCNLKVNEVKEECSDLKEALSELNESGKFKELSENEKSEIIKQRDKAELEKRLLFEKNEQMKKDNKQLTKNLEDASSRPSLTIDILLNHLKIVYEMLTDSNVAKLMKSANVGGKVNSCKHIISSIKELTI